PPQPTATGVTSIAPANTTVRQIFDALALPSVLAYMTVASSRCFAIAFPPGDLDDDTVPCRLPGHWGSSPRARDAKVKEALRELAGQPRERAIHRGARGRHHACERREAVGQ